MSRCKYCFYYHIFLVLKPNNNNVKIFPNKQVLFTYYEENNYNG